MNSSRPTSPDPKRLKGDSWCFHASLPSGLCEIVSILRSGTVADLRKKLQQSLGRAFLRLAAPNGCLLDNPTESLELAGLKDGDEIDVVAQQPEAQKGRNNKKQILAPGALRPGTNQACPEGGAGTEDAGADASISWQILG
eukprot:Skav212309  [mRNA]  locus=scaffold1913:149086:152125:- [translate_table: standard]